MALSLIVAVALSACDDNPQSAATLQPAVTLAATSTATPAPTANATTAPTSTATPAPANTVTPTPTDTATPAPTSTSTPTSTATPTPTATATPAPTSTATPTPTNTVAPAPIVPATDAEVTDLVDGNTDFAFDLYHALAGPDGNLFYSPYSISLALAMTYAGAGGDTERQMADTLGFNLAQDRLHPAFNNLGLQLASRGADAKGQDGDGFRLNIANAVWGQDDYEFLEAYLDLLTENYGSGVRPMDFSGAPEESRITINDWVADQTEDRIKDLIPQGAIDQLTRLGPHQRHLLQR